MTDGPAGIGALSIVVFDGRFDRVHYALVLASAAVATNRPATLFFTGQALRALLPEGWRRLDGDAEAREADFAARRVATFAELLDACRALGVRFIACEMGLRALGLAAADLAVPAQIAGVVTLLAETPRDGQLLFV
ncbi:peroxiredoxin family protein [Inquilinus ginsengisoli]|uniref:Peroxiredoxin family protein n=1 Tax=Inquilinus ginsengisoli TaxID=363840 RepID=A0ABU1JV65_9PROT|nr:DsrE/DsrF/DrsH-like family protein [Inquilinus ginsengisoli]MDR6292496.1 peroxiredoxin family protein [Inquilinus ginsengisoli]